MSIPRSVLALTAVLLGTCAHAATYTVTTTNDAGPGSLRQALLDANANGGPDLVAFNIGGFGTVSIVPVSPLPAITSPVTIDGYSEPLSSPNTAAAGTNAVLRIELAGSLVPDSAALTFVSGSGGSVVRGLVINRYAGAAGYAIRFFAGANTDGSAVEGCFIGTNAQGTAALPNRHGINTVASGTRIGGNAPAMRNLVSGQLDTGIFTGPQTTVVGNLVGTAANGSSPLANAGYGIVARQGGTIGGPNASDANVVAHNGDTGVRVCGNGATIRRNRIFANGALGIDLEAASCTVSGVSANDRGDPDLGANGLQNHPVLMTSWFAPVPGGPPGSGRRQITGYLDSTANRTFRVELFANPTADPSGHGEGEHYLGSIDVTTNTDGYAWFPFALALTGLPLVNEVVSATATDLVTGETSEFARTVPTLDGVRVTTSSDAGPGSLRDAITTINGGNGRNAIVFDVASGPFSIRPATPLPAIVQPLVIDGFTQPGARPNFAALGSDAVLHAELDGSLAGGSANGLAIAGVPVTIRGLAINRFAGNGIIAVGIPSVRIEGNHIGTDRVGTTARPNGWFGVDVGAPGLIGGSEVPARNLVSGNLAGGVRVLAPDVAIVGNAIGRTALGTQPLPNGQHGVSLFATNARVERNWIASNAGPGVLVGVSAGTGNEVNGNRLHDNAGLGIDLGGDGPTGNDVDDVDTGPNAHQNAPVLAVVTLQGGVLEVRGSLDRPPLPAGPRGYVLELFDNDGCDASGRGEGQRPLGSVAVAIDLDEGFLVSLSGVAGANMLTATITESPGAGTSELSNCLVLARSDALFADSFE